MYTGTWIAECFRTKGSVTDFPELTLRQVAKYLGEQTSLPSAGLPFVLDTGTYKGEYRIYGFTYATKVSKHAYEIELSKEMKTQLNYSHLTGILDMPFTKDLSIKRVSVTVENSKNTQVPIYKQYKTSLGYTLTAEHITPPTQMKFKVVRSPLGSDEKITGLDS